MGIKTGEKTVAASATRVIPTTAGISQVLGGRGKISVTPLAANTDAVTYFGGSDVTAANGWPVAKGTTKDFDAAQIGDLYCIGVTITDKVRWAAFGVDN